MDDVTFRTAGEDELEALLELWTAVHLATASVFTDEFRLFPPDRRKTFVAELDGRLISSVQLYGVPIRDESLAPITIGGIGNVSTLPEFRGRGLASRLMQDASAEMQASHYAWAFLFTRSNSFYEPLGWRTVHRSLLQVGIDSLSTTDLATDVRYCLTPELRDLRRICDSAFPIPLSKIRDDFDWEIRLPARIAEKVVFMSDSAYAIVRDMEAQVVLEEWGMPEPDVLVFRQILVAIALWAKGKGIQRMVVSAPILAEARQAIESLFATVGSVENTEAMVRPLNDRWPISRLISAFSLPHARFLRLDNF